MARALLFFFCRVNKKTVNLKVELVGSPTGRIQSLHSNHLDPVGKKPVRTNPGLNS